MEQKLKEAICRSHQASEKFYVQQYHFIEKYQEKNVEIEYYFVEGILEIHETCINH